MHYVLSSDCDVQAAQIVTAHTVLHIASRFNLNKLNEFKQSRSLSSLQLSHVSSWLQNTDVRTPFSGGMSLQDSGPLISSHPDCLDARDHCDPPSPRQFTAQLVTVRPAVRPCRLPTSSNGSKVDLYGFFMDLSWLMTVDDG